MIADPEHLDVVADGLKAIVQELLGSRRSPSAWELVEEAERKLTPRVRLVMKDVLTGCCQDSQLPRYFRQYLESLLAINDEEGQRPISQLDEALLGAVPPRREVESGIDSLLRQSKTYRGCTAFQEMITFMARFRDYAPYNNMLVKVQNPSCSFYATENDWRERFERKLKEDARPM